MYVHVAAWELENGPVPAGLEVDHLCFVTTCCRPSHLEPVTPAENLRRRRKSTHCRRGDHELTPDNVVIVRGARYCLTCRRKSRRESAARARARQG